MLHFIHIPAIYPCPSSLGTQFPLPALLFSQLISGTQFLQKESPSSTLGQKEVRQGRAVLTLRHPSALPLLICKKKKKNILSFENAFLNRRRLVSTVIISPVIIRKIKTSSNKFWSKISQVFLLQKIENININREECKSSRIRT